VEVQKFLRDHEEIVRRLARADRVTYVDPDYIPVKDATAVVNDIEVCLPLEGLIDFGQEAKRLGKEVEKTKAEYARVAGQPGERAVHRQRPPGHRRRPARPAKKRWNRRSPSSGRTSSW